MVWLDLLGMIGWRCDWLVLVCVGLPFVCFGVCVCLCCVWFSVVFVWIWHGDLFAVIGGLGDLLFAVD